MTDALLKRLTDRVSNKYQIDVLQTMVSIYIYSIAGRHFDVTEINRIAIEE